MAVLDKAVGDAGKHKEPRECSSNFAYEITSNKEKYEGIVVGVY